MDTNKIQISFFIGLLLAVFLLASAIFLPFVAPIALAFMLAIVCRPIHNWFLRKFKTKRTLAAFATILFILVVVFAPISIVIQQLTVESYNLYVEMSDRGLGQFGDLSDRITESVQKIYPSFNFDVASYTKTIISSFVNNLGSIFSGTASVILGLFLCLISLFYLLRDGHKFKKAIIELSPLADKYDKQIIGRLEQAVMSVMRGSFFVSLIQGTLVAVGFLIFGIPNVFLWGIVAALAALLPGLGTGLVVLPAVIYLFATGSIGAAIGLALWGAVIVGFVDNLILPALVGKGFMVHQVFILFSIIGGIIFFGPVGLFLGPLVIALLFALIEIYKLIILDDQHKKKTSI